MNNTNVNFVDYNFVAKQVVVEGAGLRTVFDDQNVQIVSDEIFWNEYSSTGTHLDAMIASAHAQGKAAAVSVTPYVFSQVAADHVNKMDKHANVKTATYEQVLTNIQKADIVAIDAYYFGEEFGMTTKELVEFTKVALEVIHGMGKQAALILQGFVLDSADTNDVRAMVYEQAQLGYDVVTSFDAADAGWAAEYALDVQSFIHADTAPVAIELTGLATLPEIIAH